MDPTSIIAHFDIQLPYSTLQFLQGTQIKQSQVLTEDFLLLLPILVIDIQNSTSSKQLVAVINSMDDKIDTIVKNLKNLRKFKNIQVYIQQQMRFDMSEFANGIINNDSMTIAYYAQMQQIFSSSNQYQSLPSIFRKPVIQPLVIQQPILAQPAAHSQSLQQQLSVIQQPIQQIPLPQPIALPAPLKKVPTDYEKDLANKMRVRDALERQFKSAEKKPELKSEKKPEPKVELISKSRSLPDLKEKIEMQQNVPNPFNKKTLFDKLNEMKKENESEVVPPDIQEQINILLGMIKK
ncbi:Hypothetical_protein [Hexamita inflata]|uniref:Hypothetical_protein n=1 Tax=Hexamita inflata TaxID=28002 RepID=A0AA86UVL2_9EUKA|nr:Hypothetical protein HINF_LOCUS57269 [Hexamita inflata]